MTFAFVVELRHLRLRKNWLAVAVVAGRCCRLDGGAVPGLLLGLSGLRRRSMQLSQASDSAPEGATHLHECQPLRPTATNAAADSLVVRLLAHAPLLLVPPLPLRRLG